MKLTRQDRKMIAIVICFYIVYHFLPFTPVIAVNKGIDESDGYKKIVVELYIAKKEDIKNLKDR